jgi:S-adenosylmethionine-diacylgycerolhomoserine-N-methlytransferase
MTSEAQIKDSMDRMYRWTRHVYDLTRKYYLLGRDHLIENLRPAPGENVIEVGCGTARNLVKMAKKYPQARFFGIDASDEMLKTARHNLEKQDLSSEVILSQAFAQSFAPQAPPDKIVFSYSLSIIPPWREAIDHALGLLKPGGTIHVVDFGGQEGLPAWFRKILFFWLSLFHVYYKPEILEHFRTLEKQKQGALTYKPLCKGYAFYVVFQKAGT